YRIPGEVDAPPIQVIERPAPPPLPVARVLRRKAPAMRRDELMTWLGMLIFLVVVYWYGLSLPRPHHYAALYPSRRTPPARTGAPPTTPHTLVTHETSHCHPCRPAARSHAGPTSRFAALDLGRATLAQARAQASGHRRIARGTRVRGRVCPW